MSKQTYPDQEAVKRCGAGDGLFGMAGIIPLLYCAARYNWGMNLSGRLQAFLPASHSRWLAVAAGAAPAYLVGGVVRDLLLERASLDLDVVFEGNAVEIARRLAAEHGGALTVHPAFQTAVWQPAPGVSLDLITARRETYPGPASLPVVQPASLADDLARRDFSVNTLAVRLADGELVDRHNGLPDLQSGLIRALHKNSFIDDPTRILRAIRYEQRYGFSIEPATLAWLQAARPGLRLLSPERLRHELDVLLDEPRAPSMLARLYDLGLRNFLLDVLPEKAPATRLLDLAQASPPPAWGFRPTTGGQPLRRALGYALWLMPLTSAALEAANTRLAFAAPLLKIIRAASGLAADLPALAGKPASAWVARLDGLPLPSIYAVYLASGNDALQTYAAAWRHVQAETTGETLKALGLPPGPAYKRILWQLRAARLDGVVSAAEDERKLLHQILAAN